MTRRTIICDYPSVLKLYEAFMPFVVNGGVFVNTRETFEIGEEVTLDLHLLNEADRMSVPGRIVWITPLGAQGGKPTGVGVQFTGDDNQLLNTKIETYLAGMLNSGAATKTM